MRLLSVGTGRCRFARQWVVLASDEYLFLLILLLLFQLSFQPLNVIFKVSDRYRFWGDHCLVVMVAKLTPVWLWPYLPMSLSWIFDKVYVASLGTFIYRQLLKRMVHFLKR